MPSPYCVVVPRKPLSAKQKAGRTLGSQNAERGRLTKRFFLELWDDFDKHGKQAIKACRESDPVAYIRVLASLMPKDIDLTQTADDQVRSMTDEELAALLQVTMAKLAAREKEVEAQVIETIPASAPTL